jgi:hypothetical protein
MRDSIEQARLALQLAKARDDAVALAEELKADDRERGMIEVAVGKEPDTVTRARRIQEMRRRIAIERRFTKDQARRAELDRVAQETALKERAELNRVAQETALKEQQERRAAAGLEREELARAMRAWYPQFVSNLEPVLSARRNLYITIRSSPRVIPKTECRAVKTRVEAAAARYPRSPDPRIDGLMSSVFDEYLGSATVCIEGRGVDWQSREEVIREKLSQITRALAAYGLPFPSVKPR